MNRFTLCTFVRHVLAVVLGSLCFATAGIAAEPKVNFNVPAGDAEQTLRQFSTQSGVQVIFPTQAVKGVNTSAVQGEFTTMQALDTLLAGTPLTALRDERGGTITIRREATVADAEKNGASRLADAQAANRLSKEQAAQEAERVRIKDGMVQLEDYTVTGSRIRGVLGEATVQPVFTYTRADLDRFGVQTFADLRRYIPQLPPTDWNAQLTTAHSLSPEVNVGAMGLNDFGLGLRNLGGTATLVLLDGRRLPKLGQRFDNTAAYDLSGVPLAAVERIEVLTDGASAVYGADALAGVINIILKKEFRGTELSASYANTFDTDTAEKNITLSHGFRSAGLMVNVTGFWSQTNSLAPRDRWWSASSDKRVFGGSDGRPNIPGAQGGVRSIDGSNLPGLNSPIAGIPVGSNGSSLTIADFAATTVPDRLDPAQWTSYGRTETANVGINASYEWRRWLEVFAKVGWNQTKTISPPSSPTYTDSNWSFSRVTLPASYPGNPFGVPVYLDRALWELQELSHTNFRVITYNIEAGIRGHVGDWRYEFVGTNRWSEYGANGYVVSTGGFGNIYPQLQAGANSTDPATRLTLLNDSLSHIPHSTERYVAMMREMAVAETPDLWLFDFKADGTVWQLPSGPIQVALGAEWQRDYANLGAASTVQRLGGIYERTATGYFTEARVPLVAPEQNISWIHRASLSLAARSDEYSDFKGKTVPRYALFFQPVKRLALRASYGEGYKVPTLFQLYRVSQTRLVSFGTPPRDPLRGGEPRTGSIQNPSGGNLDLNPEQSRNINAGVVAEIPGVRGLSLSVDYFDITNDMRIVAPNAQMVFDFFPERIGRAAPTPDDIAKGWAGRALSVDTRAVNFADARVRGWDFEVRYNGSFGVWGDIMLRLTGTSTLMSELRVTPTAPVQNLRQQNPFRVTGLAFWNLGPWEVGAVSTYADDYLTSTNIVINPVKLWDFQASYDFGRSSWKPKGWLRHLVGDTRLTAKVINAFDKEPQTRLGSSLGNVDPRGRRYQLSLQRKF